MNPYRSHSRFDERRMRRLIRKQTRLDKRVLARAEQRFQREEILIGIENCINAGIISIVGYVALLYIFFL